MTTKLAFDVLARDRASGTFRYIGQSAGRTDGILRKVGTGLKYVGLGIAGGLGLATKGMYELAQGAAEDQRSARAMALQFHNSADATDRQVAATERWITAQGKAYGITDDELRPALGKLVAATHDVTEARELASLAEDVAAGRGKSLATVTEALAKAENGSIAGLSRLGVKTKDAAGETLTLDQITQDLAKTYDGQAAKAAGTASGMFGRLQVILSETGEEIGYRLLPYATDFADWLLSDGVPAVSDFAGWLQDATGNAAEQAVTIGRELLPTLKDGAEAVADLGNEIVDTAGPIAHDLIPAIGDLVGVTRDAVQWVGDLPEPVKRIAFEVGVAAVVVPKFTNAIGGNYQALRQWIVGLTAAETRTRSLGTAAKTAAGVAGVAALANATTETSRTMKVASTTAGGAAIGFSMGGPWGAAIGGLIGGLGSLVATIPTPKDWELPKRAALDYSDTLDQVTGAATRATRAMVLQGLEEADLVTSAHALGINTRDLIDAALGNANATQRVTEAWQKHGTVLDAVANHNLSEWISKQAWSIQQEQQKIRQNNEAIETWAQKLKGVPKAVRVKLETIGYEPTRKQWAEINRQVKLTPKQRQIIIQAIGYDPAKVKIHGLNTEMGKTGKTRADLSPFVATMLAGLTKAQRQAAFGTADINKIIRQTTGKARADLTPLQRQLIADLGDIRTKGNTGGEQIGGAIKSGMFEGFAGAAAQLAAQAAAAVRAAVQAAKNAGDIHSPSRVMRYEVGQMLGRGVAEGIADQHGANTAAGFAMVGAVGDGAREGLKYLQAQLDNATDVVSSWRDKLRSLLDDSRSYIAGFGSFQTSIFAADLQGPTITGPDGAQTVLPPTIEQALGFAQNQEGMSAGLRDEVRKLIRLGLSPELLKQLQAQGPQGLQMIHLLAGATREQIRQFNHLNKVTQRNYRQAGLLGADRIFGADIHDARRELKVAIDHKRLAEEIVKAEERREHRRQQEQDQRDQKRDQKADQQHRELVDAVQGIGPDVVDGLQGAAGRAARRRQHGV